MIALAALMTLINQVSGTPYISGGDTPAGTDCSGLASWVANTATGRPAFGELLERGFQYGTAPNALVIGWNGGHTAVTLPDGTAVSSGEGGGVKIGGGGAYQPQFTKHMFLPMPAENPVVDMALPPAPPFADVAPPPPPPAAPFADVALPPPPPAPFVDVALPPPPEAGVPPIPEPAVINADNVIPAPAGDPLNTPI
jgi:hypothetical protein